MMVFKGHFALNVKAFKLLTTFLLSLLVSRSALGQHPLKNQPKYDRRIIHFGFCLGLNYFDFQVRPVEDLATLNGYYSIQTEGAPSYTIGIISNLRLARFFDLRFIPSFAAANRTLKFDVIEPFSKDRQVITREMESSYIEFPFELKYKSKRIDNYRLYVLGGIKYNLDLLSKENAEDDRIFKIKSSDLFYEFGFGVDIYFEYFKFSPEIKAFFGFANLLVEDETFYVEGVDILYSRSFLINLTFE